MDRIESYSELGRKYVPEQYKGSSKLLSLADSVHAQCDDLETAFQEILAMLNPQEAIGPALDYIGALVGVARRPGETDGSYRARVLEGNHTAGLPSPESLRTCIKLVTGCNVGLFPVWPAALYYVLDGHTDADKSSLEEDYMTSGACLCEGTFLCAEQDDEGFYEFGYIVTEDYRQPIVCDVRTADTLYELVDGTDDVLETDDGQALMALDFLTTPAP